MHNTRCEWKGYTCSENAPGNFCSSWRATVVVVVVVQNVNLWRYIDQSALTLERSIAMQQDRVESQGPKSAREKTGGEQKRWTYKWIYDAFSFKKSLPHFHNPLLPRRVSHALFIVRQNFLFWICIPSSSFKSGLNPFLSVLLNNIHSASSWQRRSVCRFSNTTQ